MKNKTEMKPIFKRKSNERSNPGGYFYTRDSQYGVRYRCKFCGKDNLGTYFGSDVVKMHQSDCPVIEDLFNN